jgi:hypothetical protein
MTNTNKKNIATARAFVCLCVCVLCNLFCCCKYGQRTPLFESHYLPRVSCVVVNYFVSAVSRIFLAV